MFNKLSRFEIAFKLLLTNIHMYINLIVVHVLRKSHENLTCNRLNISGNFVNVGSL